MTSDREQRWRKIAIDQLGYALNLILTFTIAALGYCFALLKDEDFVPGNPATKAFMIGALLLLTAAALFGVACVLNRLKDFRGTAKRAANKPDAPSKADLDKVGETTWSLFGAHVTMFVAGVVALAAALLSAYGQKLF